MEADAHASNSQPSQPNAPLTRAEPHALAASEAPPTFLHEPTKCIQVANLKMPYTIIELRELMETFGKFNRCWTNRTQSHCMVEFKAEGAALQAATVLFHRVWPEGGGKLVTDFIDLARMNELISKKSVPADLDLRVEQVNGVGSRDREKPGISLKLRRATDRPADSPALPRPDSKLAPAQPDPALAPDHSHSALDKLFKKTQAKPHIYYKFASPEEALLGKRQSPQPALQPQPQSPPGAHA